jgi:hypothetical protein
VIDAYLARLSIEREPPSAEALRRWHQAHVEHVPYETVWIHTGVHYGVSAEESFARIASTTRLSEFEEGALERLWQRTHAVHLAWQATN